MFYDIFPSLSIFFHVKIQLFVNRIRIRMDPRWFGSLDLDPNPWGKKLDPDPHWNRFGSATDFKYTKEVSYVLNVVVHRCSKNFSYRAAGNRRMGGRWIVLCLNQIDFFCSKLLSLLTFIRDAQHTNLILKPMISCLMEVNHTVGCQGFPARTQWPVGNLIKKSEKLVRDRTGTYGTVFNVNTKKFLNE